MNPQEEKVYSQICKEFIQPITAEQKEVWELWRKRAAERNEYAHENAPTKEEIKYKEKTSECFCSVAVFNFIFFFPIHLLGYYRNADYGLAPLSILTILLCSSTIIPKLIHKRKDKNTAIWFFKYIGVSVVWFFVMRLPFLNETEVMRNIARAINNVAPPLYVVIITAIASVVMSFITYLKFQRNKEFGDFYKSWAKTNAFFDWLSENKDIYLAGTDDENPDIREAEHLLCFIQGGFLRNCSFTEIDENGEVYELSQDVVESIDNKILEEYEINDELVEQIEKGV
ncbi:MAG: hypothetical protein MJ124_09695 [Lachnospiraceae bacterium]|nr:hypothetical protein [Lachnospiraceae bacterium]